VWKRTSSWLHEQYGQRIDIRIEDIRNYSAMRQAVAQADEVYHLAGQVAVTSSLKDPVRISRSTPKGH
jgi:CDP-paratose 2-epimerase